MHLSEGVLSPPILAAGAVLAVAGTALGLRRLDGERLMSAAMLAAAFFVGSLIHVPVGPGNVHLILNGLLGMLLGWAAFPCILAALVLQAVLFQYGGVTTLGVNTCTMALPAVTAWCLFGGLIRRGPTARTLGAFLGGALGVAGAGLLTALCLAGTDEGFLRSAQLLFLAHIPVMIAEGLITMMTVSFLAKVRPELLSPR